MYGDPCKWPTTIPETPATTPDEIAAAFAAQASTDATAPVDVTVGGFAGKAITLHVPMSYDLPNGTREEKFAACDNDMFAFYGIEGETDEARNAQGAGQIDELWILDVNGSIVILDATYSAGDTGRARRGDAGHGRYRPPSRRRDRGTQHGPIQSWIGPFACRGGTAYRIRTGDLRLERAVSWASRRMRLRRRRRIGSRPDRDDTNGPRSSPADPAGGGAPANL